MQRHRKWGARAWGSWPAAEQTDGQVSAEEHHVKANYLCINDLLEIYVVELITCATVVMPIIGTLQFQIWLKSVIIWPEKSKNQQISIIEHVCLYTNKKS